MVKIKKVVTNFAYKRNCYNIFTESISGLHTNDLKILSFLQNGDEEDDDDCKNSQYTFNGLMRKLNMHQQTLATSLQRLQKLGLIIKLDTGYKLVAQNIELYMS